MQPLSLMHFQLLMLIFTSSTARGTITWIVCLCRFGDGTPSVNYRSMLEAMVWYIIAKHT